MTESNPALNFESDCRADKPSTNAREKLASTPQFLPKRSLASACEYLPR
jgi:hypothetical protein